MKLPAGALEFKVVMVASGGGSGAEWEAGENRAVQVPKAALRLESVGVYHVKSVYGDTGATRARTRVTKGAIMGACLGTACRATECQRATYLAEQVVAL